MAAQLVRLEDALSVRLLARQQFLVQSKASRPSHCRISMAHHFAFYACSAMLSFWVQCRASAYDTRESGLSVAKAETSKLHMPL